ncbi:hypothetical protein [Thalassospira marina]|uniref:Uncharacterized protein n=1 Tax=Thalassospira marina TaxID=2048283 RepID=A0A2N3KVA9_9PROT|nr:hypothetical protein [Thalassospira marina]PKR54440.1 hypothetical protein COO20_09935 [Thalassospira marina]
MATIISLPKSQKAPQSSIPHSTTQWRPDNGTEVIVIENRFPRHATVIVALPNGTTLVRFTAINQAKWIKTADILPPVHPGDAA